MEAAGKTDIGKKRSRNEDSILINSEGLGSLPNIFIVADGMGGHNSGDVASNESIRAFCAFLQDGDQGQELLDILVGAAAHSNEHVYKLSVEKPGCEGMGTTITAASVDYRADKLYIAHVGDSRLYIVRDNEITQITIDHTYVNEMIKAGKITASEAKRHPGRNLVTRAIGTSSNVQIDGIVYPLTEGDLVLISSDGLTNMVSEEKIKELIIANDDLDMALEALINEANINGGIDNVSAILIKYER